MLREAAQFAQQNNNGICFLGAGAYQHHIPAAVWDIASRGEFLPHIRPIKQKQVRAHCSYYTNINP
jgi:glycine dehydrogenase subunit 1